MAFMGNVMRACRDHESMLVSTLAECTLVVVIYIERLGADLVW